MKNIKIELLKEFTNHPFKSYDEGELKALADSIQSIGLQNPIIVRQIPDSEQYEIIAGHNRVRACKLLNKKTIPAITKNVDDALAKLIMAETNLKQRERMKLSEKIMAYALEAEALTAQGKLTGTTKRAELSKMFGESGKQVERYLHLSKLIPPLLKLLEQRKLTQKDGLALAKLSHEKQLEANNAFEKNSSKILHTKTNVSRLNYPVPVVADLGRQLQLYEEFLRRNTKQLSHLALSTAFKKYSLPIHIAVYHRGQTTAYIKLYDTLLCAGLVESTTYATGKSVCMNNRDMQKDKSKLIVSFYGNIDDILKKQHIEEAVISSFQQSHITFGFAESLPDEYYLYSSEGTHFLLCSRHFEKENFIGLIMNAEELYQFIREVGQT